ncbi:MAG TPA: hypothetical protein VFO89_06370 [Thermoanaerobaculia bacterium]|nr:hypothetical protein [Thermoanaerobaculia bacterium]
MKSNANNKGSASEDDLQADIDRYANMPIKDVQRELADAGVKAEETIRAVRALIDEWRRRGVHHERSEEVSHAGAARDLCTKLAAATSTVRNLLREILALAQQVLLNPFLIPA